jgi:hypothetical protein
MITVYQTVKIAVSEVRGPWDGLGLAVGITLRQNGITGITGEGVGGVLVVT